MYIVLDNFDSFTFNIVQYLSEMTSEEILVVRNDEMTVEEIRALEPQGIIISPGPGRPEDAGICVELIRACIGEIPMLGVCLGHQAIAYALGGTIINAQRIMHGKIDHLEHDGRGLFRAVRQKTAIVRYHSLSVERSSLPEALEITALASDGEIMGIRHIEHRIEGLQFHPESIAGEDGRKMLENFLKYKREPCDVKNILEKLSAYEDLSFEESYDIMDDLTEGDLSDAQIAAFLMGMNMKGFTAAEIAGCVQVLRDKRTMLSSEGLEVLDTCGTGGDGLSTVNISSCTALVCSVCGQAVAKHGNRAVSSSSGSADFYQELGIHIEMSPQQAAALLKKTGFTFMYAPKYHSAMRYAAPVRRSLKMKTIMNVLGPLSNPAAAAYQLIGVYDRELMRVMAEAARMVGVKRVMTVHGHDGSDEISVSGATDICFIDESGKVTEERITPEQFGLSRCDAQLLTGGDARENAQRAMDVFSGDESPRSRAIRTSILLNSGAALFASGAAASIEDGIAAAAEAIDTGKVLDQLELLKSASREAV